MFVKDRSAAPAVVPLNKGDVAYWDARYLAEQKKWLKFDLFDWYVPFDKAFPLIKDLIVYNNDKQKILIIGVGRSNIVETLYTTYGYRDITCIDISPTIIHVMKQHYEAYTGVQFYSMDVLEMNAFSEGTFTLVIDKGTIDSLFCKNDYLQSLRAAFKSIYRVLSPREGTFVHISHGSPIMRVPYLRSEGWAVAACPLLEGEDLFVYTLVRTDNEELLNSQVLGGEATYVRVASRAVSESDAGKQNKFSSLRKQGQGGGLTITADYKLIEDLVNEIAENSDI